MKLVITDAHTGLKKGTSTVFQGAAWQRCRVHFMRNVLSIDPKGSQNMVASIIRTIVAQPDAADVNAQFDEVVRMLARSHPKVAAVLADARSDLLAFAGFPQRHWRQIWSTNSLSANRLSNGTFPSVVLMTRNQVLFGRKLFGTSRQRRSDYDRFSEEARGPEVTTTPRTPCGLIRTTDLHSVEKLHH